MKIAVIGSTMMDVVSYTDEVPAAGETKNAQGFHVAPGGKGANQAVAAGKLGADVLFVTAVGDDLFGEKSRENFAAHGVATDYVKTVANTSNGVATILVEKTGQNRILIFRGANDALTPRAVREAESVIAGCGLIVLQLEVPLDTVYEAIKIGEERNIPVLLNPAPANRELSLEMACKCEFFVPNETELAILTGKKTETVEDIEKAARTLLDRGVKNVIVTMGSRGSLWISPGGKEIVPSRKVEAVDSTGAGDAFIGCFAESYGRTGDILSSMRRASEYAALSVTKKGTQDSYATKEEFARYLG